MALLGLHGTNLLVPQNNGLDGATCEIRLSDDKLRDFSPADNTEITGKIIIKTPATVQYKNLWIQLEGLAITKFETKFDGFVKRHFTSEFIWPVNLTHLIFGSETLEACRGVKRNLKPGKHCFPFEISVPERLTYPTSFKSPYGRMQYRLAVYVNQDMDADPKYPAMLQPLRCRGYRNLAYREDLLAPLEIVKSKEKYFSKRLLCKATLTIEKQGCMCGENLSFGFLLENPMCEKITKIQIQLVSRTTYYGYNQATKNVTVVLRNLERTEETSDGEITWMGDFSIPSNLMPSFRTRRPCLEISYSMQFVVEANRKQLLKGEKELIIGTTDGCKPSVVPAEEQPPEEAFDTISLPPNYSALSSRRSSIETLPPTYDDAVGAAVYLNDVQEEDEEATAGPRPRCSTNPM